MLDIINQSERQVTQVLEPQHAENLSKSVWNDISENGLNSQLLQGEKGLGPDGMLEFNTKSLYGSIDNIGNAVRGGMENTGKQFQAFAQNELPQPGDLVSQGRFDQLPNLQAGDLQQLGDLKELLTKPEFLQQMQAMSGQLEQLQSLLKGAGIGGAEGSALGGLGGLGDLGSLGNIGDLAGLGGLGNIGDLSSVVGGISQLVQQLGPLLQLATKLAPLLLAL